MGWAARHIEALRDGRSVTFRPRGHSMKGRVEHGQSCTVHPVHPRDVRKGDVVLCRVRGHEYLHLVKAVEGRRFLIGNNRGGTNGWINGNAIFGRLDESAQQN